jgi:hypothetical protein
MSYNDEKYYKMIEKLEKMAYDIEESDFDKEEYHIFQDKIYKKFISDVSNDKIKDVKGVAKKIMSKVVRKEKIMDLWYS